MSTQPDFIVGIDLGTTNSEIAYIQDGQPVVIPDETGDLLLPSVVGLSDDGRLLVGHAARNQWMLAPERTIKSIKRQMGTDATVQLGDQIYTPQEISAIILRTLKARAIQYLDRDISQAVITVPAYFNDGQRQATREAGELAGFDVRRIINEPTAASLTYDPEQHDLKRILVYDLGGGTFDVSIVQVEAGVVEVLASHGDTQLGGDDIDAAIADYLMQSFEDEHAINLRDQPAARARILRAAEDAKKILSTEPYATIQEEYIAEQAGIPLHLTRELSRFEFENLVMPLLEKTITGVGQALDDAGLSPSQLDQVVLVGGSTRSPVVSRLLEERLQQPTHQEIDPDLCVAMGAAVQAAIISGHDVGPVLVDITPHSLGIRCLGMVHGQLSETMFSRIITRNTALPASRSEVYQTVVDGQEHVNIEVFQGESDNALQNTSVGDFTIEGLADVPAGNEVTVHMNLTLDGILRVTATEKHTGLQRQVRIDNAMARFQRDDRTAARDRLETLFETDQPVLDADYTHLTAGSSPEVPEPKARGSHAAEVQAQAVLEKAERLFPTLEPEDCEDLNPVMERLRQALAASQLANIEALSAELAEALFYLEDR